MAVKKDILAPISNINEFFELVNAGATELYCGYVPQYWNEVFNQFEDISDFRYQIGLNKKDSPKANISSMSMLEQISSASREHGVELFLTLNSLSYPECAYTYLKVLLDEISGAGIRNVIVSDIGLMKYISERFPELKITVSCLAQVTNSYAVRFYKQFNIRRIVFPRHINRKDMIDIVKSNPDIEFEFFILGGKCVYDDGYCRCNHDLGPICMDSFNCEFFSRNESPLDVTKLKEAEENFYRWTINYPSNVMIEDIYRNIGCSICLLYNVFDLNNLCSVKIAGRGKSVKVKKELVSIANRAIELASSGGDVSALHDYVRNTFRFNTDMCLTDKYCFTRGDVNVGISTSFI